MTLPRKPPFGVPEYRFSADRRTEAKVMRRPHTHNQLEVNFVQTGGLRYVFNGHTIDMAKGDFVLFWGAIPHQAVHVEPGTRFTSVYVPLEMFMSSQLSTRLKHAVLAGGFITIAKPLPFDASLMEQIHADALSNDEALMRLSYLALDLRLQRADIGGWDDLLAADHPASEALSAPHDKVVAMARYAAENGSNDIGVTDIAASVELHPKYAMALFRKSLGMTLVQYLTRLRLVTAQGLLLANDTDIASIAFEAGFGSVSRFYQVFRDQTGLSPNQFRSAFRSGTGQPAP